MRFGKLCFRLFQVKWKRKVLVACLCPTLSNPKDYSLPGSSVRGILQVRILESESEIAQSCLTLCDPIDCSRPGASVHEIFQKIVLEWKEGSGLEGNHFLLQGIFPTQGLNRCLLHCKWILYHLASGRYPGGGTINPLQYSYLEKSTDRGAWRATVHRVAQSQTRLNWLSTPNGTGNNMKIVLCCC